MSASEIAAALKGSRVSGGYVCRCPVPSHGKGRGDRTPSLSICDGDDGRLLVCCHAGCDGRDVLDELRRRGLLRDQKPGDAPKRKKPKPEPIEPDPDALALWRDGEPVTGTLGERYLKARGISQAPPSLRFLPAYEHIERRVYLPALVAAVQASDRRVVAVQVTMLDPRGDRKAQVRFPRKTFGRMHDGAVRLGPVDEVIGLAEGVETGLSAMKLFSVPTWCCLGAGRMHSVAIPETVREIHIFADADEAGDAAIARTAEANRRRRIIAHRPLSPGEDFNDALRALEGA